MVGKSPKDPHQSTGCQAKFEAAGPSRETGPLRLLPSPCWALLSNLLGTAEYLLSSASASDSPTADRRETAPKNILTATDRY